MAAELDDPTLANAAPTDAQAGQAGGRRARNRRLRERAYLDAAMDIASRDGISGLTMARLAEEVDAAVGTVYTYFPSKGELVAEIQREAIERLTDSYHLLRARSEAVLGDWDPTAAAVARLVAFGRWWIATEETFPQESYVLHGVATEPEQVIPPEELYRMLPSILALLEEARRAVVAAVEAEAIDVDDPMEAVLRWAAGLNGVLLVGHLPSVDAVTIDGARLAMGLQRDLLRGWGADPELIEQADAHVEDLACQGPLAPPVERAR
jgi:AcrR family transcriptional regulator